MLRGIVAMIDMRRKKNKTKEEYILSFCTANKWRLNDKGDGKGQPSNEENECEMDESLNMRTRRMSVRNMRLSSVALRGER